MSEEIKKEKSLEDKKAELEAQLKEIESKMDENKAEVEENEPDEIWLRTVKKIIVGLWGVIILIVVALIALYTYSNYLDKVIEDKKAKANYSSNQVVEDLNSIVTTTPGFMENNITVDNSQINQ